MTGRNGSLPLLMAKRHWTGSLLACPYRSLVTAFDLIGTIPEAVMSLRKRLRVDMTSPSEEPPNATSSTLAMMKSHSSGHFGGEGPISQMPNEILTKIFKNIDLQELLSVRVVCSRWKAVIEDNICALRKSLKIFAKLNSKTGHPYYGHFVYNYAQYLDTEEFATVSPDRRFDLRINKGNAFSSEPFCRLLGQLFPKLEYLCLSKDTFTEANFSLLKQWPELSSLVIVAKKLSEGFSLSFCEQINSLHGLRHLHLAIDCASKNVDIQPLSPTLARLESLQIMPQGNVESLLQSLGPQCTRFYVTHMSSMQPGNNLRQALLRANPMLAANLTHLNLTQCGFRLERLDLQYIYQHFVGLQYFCLAAYGHEYQLYELLTPSLANLKKLKELCLIHVGLSLRPLPALVNTNQMPFKAVTSLKILKMETAARLSEAPKNWCQTLAAICPNLEQLIVRDPYERMNYQKGRSLLREIDANKSLLKHLKRFHFAAFHN